jgi:hypothetical protein
MSYFPPKRSLPLSSEAPDADFNWPPTDKQLVVNFGTLQQREIADDKAGDEAANPSVVSPSSEPAYAAFDCPADDEDSTPSDDDDPKHSWFGNPTRSRIAVDQIETAHDRIGTRETAAEIAHLQALIEALTQAVE